jgi:hypothetical protein
LLIGSKAEVLIFAAHGTLLIEKQRSVTATADYRQDAANPSDDRPMNSCAVMGGALLRRRSSDGMMAPS